MRGTAPVSLLQPVQSVQAVYSFDLSGVRTDYLEGRDWQLANQQLVRTPTSRIPDFSTYQYTRSAGDKFAFASDPRNPPLDLNFNIYIDYVSQQSDKVVTARPLPVRPTSVLCIGDSIASGAHTVANLVNGNDSQSWCGLLRTHLSATASVRNEAVPDGNLKGVADNLQTLLTIPADTVIIAMGMNDHVFEPQGGVTAFGQQLDSIVGQFRAKGANVILVGFFQQNELWELEDPSRTQAYNQWISTVAAKYSVPFIDPLDAFNRAKPLTDAQFYNFTADFIHHPNIFGQRIYFSLMVPYFLTVNTPASQIGQYVTGPWSQ